MPRSRTLLVLATLLLGTTLGCGTTDDAGSEEGSARETTESSPEVEPASPTTEESTTTTTTGDPTTTTTGDSDDDGDDGGDDGGDGDAAVCDPLRDVSDLDKQFSADLAAGDEWSVLQGKIVEGSEELVDAYDEAIELAPEELTGDLTTLRDFTEAFIDVARTSTSLEDFGTKVTDDPNAVAAGTAALNLDEFSRETCGFSTSNE